VTLTAQAATLPLSAYSFHTLPLTALPANLLILPAQPALMATGALASAAAAISVEAGRVASWLAFPFAAYTLRVAEWFAALPGASLELPDFSWPVLLFGYLPVLAAGVVPASTGLSLPAVVRRAAAPIGLFLLVGASTFVWRAALDRPDGRLHLVAIPGGDVLIQSPTGRYVALVTTASAEASAAAFERHLPATHRAMDWILIPGGQIDPERGLTGWARFRPEGFLIHGELLSLHLPERSPGTDLIPADAGTSLDLGEGAKLQVVEAGPAGLILSVTYGLSDVQIVIAAGGRSPLPPAGSSRPASAAILIGGGRELNRLLNRAHDLGAEWLVVASPLAGEVLRAEPPAGTGPVRLITSRSGWIRLSTDGRSFTVQTERRP
jgi:competence protein ComEC